MTTNKTPSILAKALKTISISYLAFLLIAGVIEFGLLAALLLILPLITFIYKKAHNNTTEGLDEKKNALSTQIITYILEVASGKETKNEQNGYREISIFKDGVTL